MTTGSLKDCLARLGLKQAELAQLLGVSPRTVEPWATGEQALPGPVAGYLRLFEQASPENRRGRVPAHRRANKNVRRRRLPCHLWWRAKGERKTDTAVAVLKNSRIPGFGPARRHLRRLLRVQSGGRRRQCAFAPDNTARRHAGDRALRRAKGCHRRDITASSSARARAAKAIVHVAGAPMRIEMTYVGPLPN